MTKSPNRWVLDVRRGGLHRGLPKARDDRLNITAFGSRHRSKSGSCPLRVLALYTTNSVIRRLSAQCPVCPKADGSGDPETAPSAAKRLASEKRLFRCRKLGAVVTAREQVAVDIHGHRDPAVPHALLYHLGR